MIRSGLWSDAQHALRCAGQGNSGGLVYKLDGHAPEEFRLYWRLNDDILLPLDKDTKPKVGNAAWGYMLSRTE